MTNMFMTDKIEVESINEMQKLNLLHLIQNPFPFSRKLLLCSDKSVDQKFILIVKEANRITLKDWLENARGGEGPVQPDAVQTLPKILHLIAQQISELQDYLFTPSLHLLTPETILLKKDPVEFFRNQDNTELIVEKDTDWLNFISWPVLPSDLKIIAKPDSGSTLQIWQYFNLIDPGNSDLYQKFGECIKDGRWENLAKLNYIEQAKHAPLKTKNNTGIRQDDSSIRYEEDYSQDIAKEHSLDKRNSKIKKESSKPGKTAKKEKRRKSKTKMKQRTLSERIKSYFYKNKVRKDETTIPLTPQDELFRLAMISEGQPGTLEENTGLRVFILIDEFLIGRDKSICDLVLNEKSIGRVHARISRHGSHYFMEDLGSANGTYIDGKKLNKHQTYSLKEFCRLKFAELPFYFTIE